MRATTDDDPYAHVAKGPLKLKNDQSVIKKYVSDKSYFQVKFSYIDSY